MIGPVTTEMLKELAAREDVTQGSWGLEDPILRANSESWAPYLRFLHYVVKQYKPRAVLECGVYMGTATRHMALGYEHSRIIGVDVEFHPSHWNNTLLENIYLIRGDTTDDQTLAQVETFLSLDERDKVRRKIELMFIDSSHDGDTPKREFELYSGLFGAVCIVACDDILMNEQMHEFWEWLPGEKVELNFLHPSQHKDMYFPGFGVSIVRRSLHVT